MTTTNDRGWGSDYIKTQFKRFEENTKEFKSRCKPQNTKVFSIMKIDVIIGHSNTHDSRDRNLKFIVARYQKLLPAAKITIVEQNTESDLSELSINHILRKTPEPFDYSRGYGFNEGAKVTDGDYLIFSDNDIMLHEDLLKNFEKLVNGYDFLFLRKNFLTFQDGTKKVIAGDNLDESWLGRNRPRVADNGAGGVCIMSRKGFYKVYGWEPSIGSWCPEDELMRSKVDTFDLKIGRSPYDMFHLDHDTKAHRRLARINDKKTMERNGRKNISIQTNEQTTTFSTLQKNRGGTL